jgi:hypothetical protein
MRSQERTSADAGFTGRTRPARWLELAALTALLAGCATLQQIAALRHVDFAIDRASGARLAGIELSRVRSYNDLTPAQVASLGVSLARRELPLAFQLHLRAENPAENSVTARLLEMDWWLLIDNRETVSGTLVRSFELPPGQPRDIPLEIRLDLLEFFDDQARDMVELALAVAGAGGAPKRVAVRASPTIDTAIGPIRYPQPITIVSREVGGELEELTSPPTRSKPPPSVSEIP